MKFIIRTIITVLLVGFSTSLFAQESNLDFKVGIAYPDAPDKVGLDTAIAFNLGLDKYFTIGAETGFGWIKWEDKDAAEMMGEITLAQVEKANAYSLPLLATATIRFADVMSSYGFMPYISGGAGYSWTWYDHPEFEDTFHGFTWQVTGGIIFKPGEGSAINVIIDAGYRGAGIENSDSYELDMSGFIARIGVSFPMGSTD